MPSYIAAEILNLGPNLDEVPHRLPGLVTLLEQVPGFQAHVLLSELGASQDGLLLMRWRDALAFWSFLDTPNPEAYPVASMLAALPLTQFCAFRSFERFIHRPRLLTVSRLRLAPGEDEAVLTWLRGLRQQLMADPGVISARLLVAKSRPGDWLSIAEFRDSDTAARSLHVAVDSHPPPNVLSIRRYQGPVNERWIQADFIE